MLNPILKYRDEWKLIKNKILLFGDSYAEVGFNRSTTANQNLDSIVSDHFGSNQSSHSGPGASQKNFKQNRNVRCLSSPAAPAKAPIPSASKLLEVNCLARFAERLGVTRSFQSDLGLVQH